MTALAHNTSFGTMFPVYRFSGQLVSSVPSHPEDDGEPDIYEPSETLDEAIARAEANKRPGELPVPRSSWVFG